MTVVATWITRSGFSTEWADWLDRVEGHAPAVIGLVERAGVGSSDALAVYVCG
jgi:hypothetical protein